MRLSILFFFVPLYGKEAALLPYIHLMAIFFLNLLCSPPYLRWSRRIWAILQKKGFVVDCRVNCWRRYCTIHNGVLSEKSTANAYVVPLICFVVVAWFGWKDTRLKIIYHDQIYNHVQTGP